MKIVHDYRGYRIEVNARESSGAWDAEARIWRLFSEEKPRVEIVTCRKPTAETAEERVVVYARQWVNRLVHDAEAGR